MARPWEIEDVRDRVGKRVGEFLHAERPALDDVGPEVGALVDTVGDFMVGGKRLRAMFLYWGWRAAGGPDNEPIISAAAAMEFLQACALIHDDVMDGSDSRRGRPSVHRQFAKLHRDAGWHGSPEDFGAAAAILVGDLCLTWADTLLLTADLPPEDLRRAKPVYDRMRTELMAGQYLDVLEQARQTGDVDDAVRVATYKSAKYTIERPLQLGAVLAGGDEDVLSGLSRYGIALGLAFQLRDDLLGVFGDPRDTGKPIGDDLREGKRTALVAIALATSDPAGREAIEAGLGDRGADDATIRRLTRLIAATPARDRVERMIEDAARDAREALAQTRVAPVAGDVLADLVGVATDRSA